MDDGYQNLCGENAHFHAKTVIPYENTQRRLTQAKCNCMPVVMHFYKGMHDSPSAYGQTHA